MSTAFAKCFGCFIVFSLNVAASVGTFVYIRTKCQRHALPKKLSLGISAASCFSIGLFLGICYLGLYHSAATKMLNIQGQLSNKTWLKDYPISEALLCLGFFILWIFECIAQLTFQWLTGNSQQSKYGYPSRPRSDFSLHHSVEDNSDHVHLLATHETQSLTEPCSNQFTAATIDTKSSNRTAEDFQTTNSSLKSLLLTLAMGTHAFLEALGFGLLDTANEVLSMGLAMVLHQTVCAATLGLRLARSCGTRATLCYPILLLISYLILVPIGTAIGLGLHNLHGSHSPSTVVCVNTAASPCEATNTTVYAYPSDHLQIGILMSVLQNFAASAFLYVVFMEILPAELSTTGSPTMSCHITGDNIGRQFQNRNLVSCFFAFLGFGLVATLRLFHHHSG